MNKHSGCMDWDKTLKRVVYTPTASGSVEEAKKAGTADQNGEPPTELSFEQIAERIEERPERGRLWDILSSLKVKAYSKEELKLGQKCEGCPRRFEDSDSYLAHLPTARRVEGLHQEEYRNGSS